MCTGRCINVLKRAIAPVTGCETCPYASAHIHLPHAHAYQSVPLLHLFLPARCEIARSSTKTYGQMRAGSLYLSAPSPIAFCASLLDLLPLLHQSLPSYTLTHCRMPVWQNDPVQEESGSRLACHEIDSFRFQLSCSRGGAVQAKAEQVPVSARHTHAAWLARRFPPRAARGFRGSRIFKQARARRRMPGIA